MLNEDDFSLCVEAKIEAAARQGIILSQDRAASLVRVYTTAYDLAYAKHYPEAYDEAYVQALQDGHRGEVAHALAAEQAEKDAKEYAFYYADEREHDTLAQRARQSSAA